ncbi:bifunctional ADP-dependent NAD(P)H-hydrate dehydratase/NAD(P)H-hydrate epimerase [Rhodoplanes sp. Z2-YC6860]|uniref:bifunctional ADP-dependent NAD(P)H-hydrate dehydratase/NAD(P)H-hydrate epimerase n=1 Tax=Rhodoplanes sp. Z2-YC6860 TaxID=674703 RepID=UPI00083489D6|nr:bifunctional ADP-dependent NAD(P)H-hydrate dehydratase/NAD(P)H-hydrate epimerase [Rhodoplanes sp. Z2-YC6860]
MELLTTAEMAQADRLTIEGGVPGIRLMEAAGRAVADAVARHAPGMVCVVAGPGNNGGDGFVCARILAGRGYRVRLLLLGDRDRLKGDAAEAFRSWSGPVETAEPAGLAGADLTVDALFGAGLDRPVTGSARAMIEAINETTGPVIAVDLPSGINGTSGAEMGVAVNASETVTFFRRKPGHLLLPGRLHCGPVEVVDIGIPESVLATIGPRICANAQSLWAGVFPVPQSGGHKYRRGHAVIVSGGPSHTGAARLAARGALRAGAGLVTLASPRDALAINAAASLAVMVRATDGASELAALLSDPRLNTVVLGPGGGVGAPMRELVLAALQGERAVVLDADALTSFAEDPAVLFGAIRARGAAPTVLTPHEGEFARLFSNIVQISDKSSKCDRTHAAAEASGAVVLLKGSDTVVAAPDGRASITENAPPWLATAGSGDVLAGFVAGLLAQGMPAFEAASAATWLHGEAGTEAGPGLISEDLPDALRMVYRRLFVDLGVWP